MQNGNFYRITPYYKHHINMGAQMMDRSGWLRPLVFSTPQDEVLNTRNHIGIIDGHSMGKIEVRGKEAFHFMQFIITNDLNRIKKGRQGIYTCICNERGGIIDDVIVYYISNKHLYFITNTVSRERVLDWLFVNRDHYGFDVEIIDTVNATAYLSIQGPKSLFLMHDLFGESVSNLKYFEMTNVRLGNVPILIARTGFTGESGFEFNFPSEFGHSVWEYLVDRGEKYHMKPVGGTAIQLMRTEKAYRAHGTDMTTETNPYEAGIDWTVRLEKGDFLGRDALLKIKENGVNKCLKGFEVEGGHVLEKGTPLFTLSGRKGGFITTCYDSPTLNKVIAMGYVFKEHFAEEEFLAKENVKVKIVPMPFYDPKGDRLKLTLSNQAIK